MKLNELDKIDDGTRQFALWALAVLGMPVSEDACFEVPAAYQADFGGALTVRLVHGQDSLATGKSPAETPPDAELGAAEASDVAVDREFVEWLMERLRSAPRTPDALPAPAPIRVHDLSTRLFAAYTVDQGSLHLSGCTLEERPVLRQTWLKDSSSEPLRLAHRYTDAEGCNLPAAMVAALGIETVRPPEGPLPRLSAVDVAAWSAAANRSASTGGDRPPQGAPELVSIVWCQFAAGKIAFVIGQATAEIPFSGWARRLAMGEVQPPAFVCPVTGIESYSIAATDDGRITAREAIRACAISGRRVLLSDLKTCELTDQAVLPEYIGTCPVSGQVVLASLLTTCDTCHAKVSPVCVKHGTCAACRHLVSVSKDDPRMARVLGEYPQLDRWRRWRIGETSTSYILVAAALIKRVLIVLDKDSLEPIRLATRSRFASLWVDPPLTERQELLR